MSPSSFSGKPQWSARNYAPSHRRVVFSSVTLQRPPLRLALFTIEAISNSRAISSVVSRRG
ncbi:hypothetical protein Bca52824_019126 [Brassica carinata]|uniref:Uncharacterized protein n=1 Tax=Brassica carinata TaxID=52824 RepID=A0A8X7VQS7_BRACI|nr:hypothetical protein Bca52824_019126 [Brassica carinata]